MSSSETPKTEHSYDKALKEIEENIIRGREQEVIKQLESLTGNYKEDLANYTLGPPQEDVSLLQLAAFFHRPKKLHKSDQEKNEATEKNADEDISISGSKEKKMADATGDTTASDEEAAARESVVFKMAEKCPSLIWKQRKDHFEGQNVLHTLVSKKDVGLTKAVLSLCDKDEKDPERKRHILKTKAKGSSFRATIMMGELPLSIAALTFNDEMVELLLREGARIYTRTSRGDTVFHTLVRYAYYYPDKAKDVKTMIVKLHTLLSPQSGLGSYILHEADQRDVWLMENEDRLTALRLSAKLAQPELFKLILGLKGVYVHFNFKDGPFDSLRCDITEIDAVACRIWFDENILSKDLTKNKVSPDTKRADGMTSTAARPTTVGCCPDLDTASPTATAGKTRSSVTTLVSILEIICETGRFEKALEMLSTYVVKSIIREKWRHYQPLFVIWFIAHVILMVFFTTYAVYKARIIRCQELQQLNTTGATGASSAEEAFVRGGAIVAVFVSVFLLFLEAVRIWKRQPFKLRLIHHNGVYRVLLVIFALSLLTDSIWYFANRAVPDNNHFLVLALLVGWWFMTFFLRPCRKFSFLTVMLQKVLLGDLLRFGVILFLVLLAFSVAMYITYLPTPGPLPEEFEDMGVTLLTMFNLMLGLTEIQILYTAPYPWLAIVLFVVFTLLAYLLMLNALIAMMSNTCSIVAQNRETLKELQRLSVVLMLESMLKPFKMWHCCGTEQKVARYNIDDKHAADPETRIFMTVTQVQRDDSSDAEPEPDSTASDAYDQMFTDDDQSTDLIGAYTRQLLRLEGTFRGGSHGDLQNTGGSSIRVETEEDCAKPISQSKKTTQSQTRKRSSRKKPKQTSQVGRLDSPSTESKRVRSKSADDGERRWLEERDLADLKSRSLTFENSSLNVSQDLRAKQESAERKDIPGHSNNGQSRRLARPLRTTSPDIHVIGPKSHQILLDD
ncbi:hypothetical protein BaRGS_00030300 [Batillaria attramentaria]|uniref:Uncharacterized protein n=1 Tax=Batillaria attramentaria TaxID=370345 RepID=A0ABD0JUU7_9CAEN